jgi:hypothetical protein
MAKPHPLNPIDVSDYLAAELESDVRHEYVDGHIFAMAGCRVMISGSIMSSKTRAPWKLTAVTAR